MNTPETDAKERECNRLPRTMGYIKMRDHARRLETERDELRRQIAEECKSWNTLTNENADLRMENAALKRGFPETLTIGNKP